MCISSSFKVPFRHHFLRDTAFDFSVEKRNAFTTLCTGLCCIMITCLTAHLLFHILSLLRVKNNQFHLFSRHRTYGRLEYQWLFHWTTPTLELEVGSCVPTQTRKELLSIVHYIVCPLGSTAFKNAFSNWLSEWTVSCSTDFISFCLFCFTLPFTSQCSPRLLGLTQGMNWEQMPEMMPLSASWILGSLVWLSGAVQGEKMEMNAFLVIAAERDLLQIMTATSASAATATTRHSSYCVLELRQSS